MFNNTVEVIQSFTSSNYSLEMQQVYQDSLALMDVFEYNVIYEQLNDVFFDPESEDPELASLRFHETMTQGIRKVLEEHSIVLFEEVRLDQANKVLSSLFLIQSVEDYVPILRILESNQMPEETFGMVVEQLTDIDMGTVMAMLDSENSNLPQALDGIKRFLQDMEAAATPPSVDVSESRKRMEEYFQACGTDNIAYLLLSSGMMLEQPAAVYYPYVDEGLVTDNDEDTAKNLLSFFLMSADTFAAPLESYRRYSESLLHDNARIPRVEEFFMKELAKYEQYKSAQREARSIQNKTSAVGSKS